MIKEIYFSVTNSLVIYKTSLLFHLLASYCFHLFEDIISFEICKRYRGFLAQI